MTRSQIFREWFGVHPAAGRLISALHAAGGETVPHATLLAVTGQTKHGLDMSLKRLRCAMEAGAIISKHGVGYQLAQHGLEDCERALADASERVAA